MRVLLAACLSSPPDGNWSHEQTMLAQGDVKRSRVQLVPSALAFGGFGG